MWDLSDECWALMSATLTSQASDADVVLAGQAYQETAANLCFSRNVVSVGVSVLESAFPTAKNEVITHRQSAIVSQVRRSEEHTSELQSLMRISYAVFCL